MFAPTFCTCTVKIHWCYNSLYVCFQETKNCIQVHICQCNHLQAVSSITSFIQYCPSLPHKPLEAHACLLLGTRSGPETVCHFPLPAGSAASKKHSLTQHSAIPAQHVHGTIALRNTVNTDLLPLQYLSSGNQPCPEGISNLKEKGTEQRKRPACSCTHLIYT